MLRTAVGILFLLLSVEARANDGRLPGLSGEVSVNFDGYGIPHIEARSWPDACRVLGYLHASDRLWQMDVLRRKASGTSAEVFGRSQLESDILVRQLGIRRGCEELWKSDKVPQAMRDQVVAYTAGVNARREELRAGGLPALFGKLGYEPGTWSDVDCLVFGKYMGWDQSGTMDDLWFGTMVEKLGVSAVESLWPLERPFEVPAVKLQTDRTTALILAPRPQKEGFPAAPLLPVAGASPAYEAAFRRLAKAGWLSRSPSFGSNNWAVDGTKTASGKPMLCSDPHLGFSLPSLWYACRMTVGKESIAGVTFPGSPTVVIGHNDVLGWGITNLQADACDYYVETMHPSDPMQYRHRGEWKTLARVTESIPVRGGEPQVLEIDSTVHGPIISRDERVISLAWTGLGPTTESIGLWEMNHARNLKDWLAAADKVDVPAMNFAYADAQGNIAVHPCGTLPVRLPGEGRIPMPGASGAHDWTAMIPHNELPLAVNPPDHFIATANGRPAPAGYPHYLGWMWDASYRVRRIHEMLAAADDLTLESMGTLQNDVRDKAAERFVPILLEAIENRKPDNEFAVRAAEELRKWDDIADADATGPIIWQRWLTYYRDGVWDDEWSSRGMEKERGSWGFSGTNRREPMLEVLEYLTREHPDSIWFDDRDTADRETRDAVMVKAFLVAVAELRSQLGDDFANWQWRRLNLLRVNSTTGDDSLARKGGSVPGTQFTVNPGSSGGYVGGGASYRLIVDFSQPSKSLHIYPGGQNEDPTSPNYADQMLLWAKGEYVTVDGEKTKTSRTVLFRGE